MIDRESRDRCAALLRALAARELTGDDFENAMDDLASRDPAIRAMYTQGWSLYTEGCRVDRQAARAVRPELARSVLFLQSDAEYLWPPYPSGDFPVYNWLCNIFTLGWWERRKAERLHEWLQHGDSSVWPFHCRADFEAACAEPRLLVGSCEPAAAVDGPSRSGRAVRRARASKWIHPANDGRKRVAYKLLDEPERNARLSALLNEVCHVFHEDADGNWASFYKDKYARLLAAEIAELPFLVGRLLGTGDRVIKMVTHRAIELNRAGGPAAGPPG